MTLSPLRLQPFDESFMTISITGHNPANPTVVKFDNGPDVEPSFVSTSGLIVWVPMTVMTVIGQHAVDVYVTTGSGVLHYGPLYFTVDGPPPDPTPPPEITLPEVVVEEATSPSGANVTFTVSTSDGSIGCSPSSGSLFPLGTTTVHCTATNANGSTSGEFVVVVEDTVAPVVTVPADIVTANPFVTFTVTAVDALDPSPDIFCSPTSGQNFPVGTTRVNCFAVDAHANFGYGSFNVTVSGGAPPVLMVPDDILAEATSPAGAVVTFTATATENGVVTCSPASGSTFPLGTTTVVCTATNDHGSDTEEFDVTVADTQAPVIVLLRVSPNSLWPPDHKMVPVEVTVVAIDVADPAPTCMIVSIASNQPVNGEGDGDTSPDWEITGPLTADLRAERAGTGDRIYTITVQCTDSAGNSTTENTYVTVTQSRRRR